MGTGEHGLVNKEPKKFTVYGADVYLGSPRLISVVIYVPWDASCPPPNENDEKFLVDKTDLLACYLIREGYMANPKTQKVNLISLCRTKKKQTEK